MKRLYRSILPVATLAGIFMLTACDWSSGSQENFNTSGGSSSVNISGFYSGNVNGGRAVAQTSNGNITSFTIQQSGNRVDVIDNQGSTYVGSIGAPLFAGNLSSGTVQSGATVSTYQISWSGKDGVAARNINFTGVLTLVAVTDINAVTSTSTSTKDSDSGTDSVIPPAAPDTGTGDSNSTSNSSSSTTTTTNTYSFSGPTSQLQLQGTWSEEAGLTSNVSAYGPPAQGNIVTSN
ncbi:hypothetical protein P3T73_13320 [Kiritimatiellota bacterium B12222]|nr:hypothetical protein P3T73_13320 [Kiritimatiellota bacterium B12222]